MSYLPLGTVISFAGNPFTGVESELDSFAAETILAHGEIAGQQAPYDMSGGDGLPDNTTTWSWVVHFIGSGATAQDASAQVESLLNIFFAMLHPGSGVSAVGDLVVSTWAGYQTNSTRTAHNARLFRMEKVDHYAAYVSVRMYFDLPNGFS
jgi:hypothetical protein